MIEEYFTNYCAKQGYKAHQIKGRQRAKELVTQRMDIAKHLYAMKYSYCQIAEVMDRNHTAIIYLVDDEYRERKKGEYRKRYHDNKGVSDGV